MRGAPQSSQNADDGAFSALHCGHRRASGLPHAAQNFLPVVLSVPHLEQRTRLPPGDPDWLRLYHPASRGDQPACRKTIAIGTSRSCLRLRPHA